MQLGGADRLLLREESLSVGGLYDGTVEQFDICIRRYNSEAD